jgi:phosphoribosylaminoimidazole-succinocarboxamide synthase
MNGCRVETVVAISESGLEGLPRKQGKVRDVYDLGDQLLLVATDRISAFDWVLPTPIPDKGRVLSSLSEFWFERLGVPNHLISSHVDDFPVALDDATRKDLRGRAMLVRKARVAPFECVVRGYLSGSGWKEYRASGEVCGVKLPPGLVESDRIDPIFTPATKAETGHDENISFAEMTRTVAGPVADELRDRTLSLYALAADYARQRGIIIADTKFEFGELPDGKIILIDEVLTPDSSRFWPADKYQPGRDQPSFDKQFVRNYLETITWNKQPPGPRLPQEVIEGTRARYLEAYERITGKTLEL